MKVLVRNFQKLIGGGRWEAFNSERAKAQIQDVPVTVKARRRRELRKTRDGEGLVKKKEVYVGYKEVESNESLAEYRGC